MANQIHVVRRQNEWVVVVAGNRLPTSTHNTKLEALESGKKLAKQKGGELISHYRNGRFQAKHSYGNDPYPPPG